MMTCSQCRLCLESLGTVRCEPFRTLVVSDDPIVTKLYRMVRYSNEIGNLALA